MEAGAAQDRRRLRAARGPSHPLPRLRQEGSGLLPDVSPPHARASLGTDLRRKRLEARVPWPGPVDVEVVLLHLPMETVEDAPGRAQRLHELLLGALAQPQVKEELLLGDAEVDLGRDVGGPVDEAGTEQLTQRNGIVVLRDGRDEAL